MISWFWKKRDVSAEAESERLSGEQSNDPLMERANRLKRKAAIRKQRAKEPEDETPATSFLSNIVFIKRTMQVVHTLWDDYFSPVFGFLYPLFRWIAGMYRRVFEHFAFLPDEHGERTLFCRKRSAFTIVVMAVVTMLFLHQAVFRIVPYTIAFGYDAVAINFFSYEDTLVFSKPDWVSGEKGVLSVFACRRYPCVGQDDSVEYRIRDSVYLDVVRTLTRFEPHDPGELAGAFLSEENKCTIKAYGVRVKYLHLHPYIIEATCTPIQS